MINNLMGIRRYSTLALRVRSLLRAVQRYRAHAAQHQFGMNVTEVIALSHLYAERPLTAAELAAWPHITSAATHG